MDGQFWAHLRVLPFSLYKFYSLLLRWRELDLGHNTSMEMFGRMAELWDDIGIYGKAGWEAGKQLQGNYSNWEG
jgi:hypothetical protein